MVFTARLAMAFTARLFQTAEMNTKQTWPDFVQIDIAPVCSSISLEVYRGLYALSNSRATEVGICQ